MSKNIEPSVLLHLGEVFTNKNWPIKHNSRDGVSKFDRFIDRLQYFDQEQQYFLIELTSDFEVYPMMDYFILMKNSLQLVSDLDWVNDQPVYVLPLLRPYEERNGNRTLNEKSKSCTFVHYMLEANDLSDLAIFRGARFLKNIEQLKNQRLENAVVIFVDDYIGSGETAVNVIEDYQNELQDVLNFTQDCSVIISSIVGQEEGIKYILNNLENVDVLTDIIKRRGISDKYVGDDLSAKVIMMENMEKKAGCKAKFSFGHNRTEGLVTFMDKTPNNTFPVFWHETSTKPAPFPRHHRYKGKK